jgi:hypothetical protein
MNALLFGDIAGPNEGWVRTPDLNPSWEFCLSNVYFFLRRPWVERLNATGTADAANRIPNTDLAVRKVPATPGTEMPTMGMDAKPVAVQVRLAAVRTRDVPHLVSEYRSCHVINGIEI